MSTRRHSSSFASFTSFWSFTSFLSFLCLSLPAPAAAQAARVDELRYPPLHDFEIARPGDQLDDWLESRAASIEAAATADSTRLSLSALAQDFPDALRVFADVLRRPAFDGARLGDVAQPGHRRRGPPE